MREVTPLLDGMRALRADGTLVRDAWLSVHTDPQQYEHWSPCIAPVVVNMHANAYSRF